MAEYEDRFWWSKDGIRLHYRDYAGPADAASRPPIICMHGLTRNARDFADLAHHLSQHWRVLVLEMRGRGESGYAKDPLTYVPLTYLVDIEALLLEQGIDRFIAVGTSLGGLLTMLLASTRPGRVVAAVLNDVGPELEAEGLARIRGYVGQGRSYETWVHAARALEEQQGHVYPAWELTDWLAYAKRLMVLGPGGRIVFDYDMKIAEPFMVPGGEAGVDLWPAFDALGQVPVLLVRGGNSDILSAGGAARMMARLQKGRFVEVPDTGHAPTLDEPAVRAAMDDLLDDLARAEVTA